MDFGGRDRCDRSDLSGHRIYAPETDEADRGFSLGPSVGLVPPPHPIVVFLRRHGSLLLSVYGIFVLAHNYTRPLTSDSVLGMALAATAIVFGVMFWAFLGLFRSLDRTLDMLWATMKAVRKLEKRVP
ncbi:MAG: hypothetical protein WBC04_15230 [Candidatus Acidiferrales bacterium]